MNDEKKAPEEKKELTKEELLEAEEKVLFPETHSKSYTFLGVPISLRPLPISVSKKLHNTFKPAQKRMTDIQRKTQEATKTIERDGKEIKVLDEDKLASMLTDSDIDFDMQLAETILDCVFILSSFYGAGKSKQEIDDNCNLPGALDFIETQFALQGENDFLLRPLVTTMKLMKNLPNITKMMESMGENALSL